MKIYLDLVFLLNFGFDFMLLLSVSVILKRNASFKRLVLGSIIGAFTIFCLFIPLTSLELFLIKFVMSIIMVLVTFSYKNINYSIKNLVYLYMTSIVLGGFLYYLNIEFSYKQEGLVFYHHGLSINFIILVLMSPIVLYNYVKQGREKKNIVQYYHQISVSLDNFKCTLIGYLDTGNVLEDPYFHKPIVVINQDIIPENIVSKIIYVPVSTINNHEMMRCFFVDKIEIEGIGVRRHVLVGISPEKIHLDGVDVLLQTRILEG